MTTTRTRTPARLAIVAVAAATALTGLAAVGTSSGGAAEPASRTLTAKQTATLTAMREEEKLAHDVYTALASKSRVFSNIARSEQQHESRLVAQLKANGIADPLSGYDDGEFKSARYQRLYDTLVKRGSTSTVAALRVGARIEELDIADLERAIARTSDPALKRTYRALQRASYNHLRAFVRQLDRRGVDYAPTVLDRDDYDAIIDGARGGSRGGGGRGHGGR